MNQYSESFNNNDEEIEREINRACYLTTLLEKLWRVDEIDEQLREKLHEEMGDKEFPVFEGVTYESEEEIFEKMKYIHIEIGGVYENVYRKGGLTEDLELAVESYQEALNLRNEKNLKNDEEVNLEEKVENLKNEVRQFKEENHRDY